MKEFQSILIVLPFRASQATLKHLVLNSMILGQWLGCEVHFLARLTETPLIETVIAAFKHNNADCPETLIIHPAAENPADRVLETIEKYSCSLVILVDSVVLHPAKGRDERRLLELSPSPVLFLPKTFNFERYPPQGFLVPLSGEQKTSEALSASLKLAYQSNSSVDFLHIMTPNEPCTCAQSLESLGDQLHHEYRNMTDKIVSEASPYSTPEERRHVRHFFHCTGFTTPEIVKQLEDSPGAILVLEWNGTLAVGRANTIKGILRKTHSPVLFVRSVHERKSTLRVGRNLRAA